MPRVAKAVLRKTDSFPWYEWTEEFEWDDDEFEGPRVNLQATARENWGIDKYWNSCQVSQGTNGWQGTAEIEGNV
jgi:hypothetical protein